MIIDSHAHVMLPLERQIALMDEAGIDRTILFTTTVHPEQAADLDALQVELAKLSDILSGKRNALAARKASIREQMTAIKTYPDRFLGFGTVPVALPAAGVRTWLEEQVVAKGLRGLSECTLAPGTVGQLEPIFAAASDYDRLPLWVHTFDPLRAQDIRDLVGLADRFPTVPVILGHLGGVNWLAAIELARPRRNLYLDLSAVFSPLAPQMAIRALPDRTLFSSDAPYGDPVLSRLMIERVTDSDDVRSMVLGGNVAQLLRLSPLTISAKRQMAVPG